eukprot:ANDGO_06576.mRNA.1 Putative ankyrin repeat protein RF_0381
MPGICMPDTPSTYDDLAFFSPIVAPAVAQPPAPSPLVDMSRFQTALLTDSPAHLPAALFTSSHINLPLRNGLSALHWAAVSNAPRCAYHLLTFGLSTTTDVANAFTATPRGLTALHIAADRNHHAVVRAILLALAYQRHLHLYHRHHHYQQHQQRETEDESDSASSISRLLDARDAEGFSAALFAAREGQVAALLSLLVLAKLGTASQSKCQMPSLFSRADVDGKNWYEVLEVYLNRRNADDEDEDEYVAIEWRMLRWGLQQDRFLSSATTLDTDTDDDNDNDSDIDNDAEMRDLSNASANAYVDAEAEAEKQIAMFLARLSNAHVYAMGRVLGAQNSRGWTALMLAAENGRTPLLALLLRLSSLLSQRFPHLYFSSFSSFPSSSSFSGHSAGAAGFLGGILGAVEARGWTALHFACQDGHADCAALLLAHGAQQTVVTLEHATPLHLAAQNGHLATVTLFTRSSSATSYFLFSSSSSSSFSLSNAGNDSEKTEGKNEERWRKRTRRAPRLVDAALRDGTTALLLAVRGNWAEIVRELVTHGRADVTATNVQGFGLMHFAAKAGYVEILRILVEAGASPIVPSSSSSSPITTTTTKTTRTTTTPSSSPLRLEVDMCSGWTPLHFAIQDGREEAVRFLVHECGVSIEDRPHPHGPTPLHLAAQCGHSGIVSLLLDAFQLQLSSKKSNRDSVTAMKQFVDARVGPTGATPLHLAVLHDSVSVCLELVRRGASLNAVTADGSSVFHYAASQNAYRVSAVLLAEAGAASVVRGCVSDMSTLFGGRAGDAGLFPAHAQRVKEMTVLDVAVWRCASQCAILFGPYFSRGYRADALVLECDFEEAEEKDESVRSRRHAAASSAIRRSVDLCCAHAHTNVDVRLNDCAEDALRKDSSVVVVHESAFEDQNPEVIRQ